MLAELWETMFAGCGKAGGFSIGPWISVFHRRSGRFPHFHRAKLQDGINGALLFHAG